jgi:hypothetical protein
MSQAGFTPIQLYYSSTASASPSAGNLASGELALNITDGKLFYKDNGGSVQVLATKAGASGDVVGPASSTDNALVRFDATTGKLVQNSVAVLSDAGALSGLTDISASGSVTLSGGTANGVAYLNGSKVLTTGSALTFDGTFLQLNGAYFANSGAVSNIVAVDSTSAFFDTSSSVYPFRWLLGGSEAMRLTSTGLGIGTSSPAGKLDVQGGNLINGNGTIKTGFSYDTNGLMGTLSNHSLGVLVNSSVVARFDTSGHLGLGVTANANTKLDVDGPIRAKGYTVAALPTGVVGARAYVTNALAPVALATVVGGGSAVVPVFFNGTDWIVA